MLEIKLFSSFLFSWRMSAVPISGAKVDIIPYSFISWRSFDFRQCSKVFSGVSICSNPFRFVQKRCFYSKNFFVSHTTSDLPCDLGVFTIIGLTPQHTQFCFLHIVPITMCFNIRREPDATAHRVLFFRSTARLSDFFPSSLSFAACRSTSRRVALATVRTQEPK
jgi:hypothetical protein